jgi:ribonuclease HI
MELVPATPVMEAGEPFLYIKGQKKFYQDTKKNTTNNRMELRAAIEGLKALKEPCRVKLYSDSAYLINSFNEGWIDNWKRNGWTRGDKKEELKNQDLWKELERLTNVHSVDFIKVKGHSDNEYNNRCDKLATGEILKMKEKGD